MPVTRRLPPRERRPLIERAATELFAGRGFAATSVEDIARAAGVTKPILYRHFESKRELAITLLERYRDELIAATLARYRPGGGPPEQQISSMIDAWLAHVEAHPAEARFLFAPIAGDPEVERVQRELHARQAAAQAALLREFAPRLSETEAEPRGEIVRAGFAAIALWRLDNPAAPRSLAHDSLLRLALAMLDDAGAETRRERRKGHV